MNRSHFQQRKLTIIVYTKRIRSFTSFVKWATRNMSCTEIFFVEIYACRSSVFHMVLTTLTYAHLNHFGSTELSTTLSTPYYYPWPGDAKCEGKAKATPYSYSYFGRASVGTNVVLRCMELQHATTRERRTRFHYYYMCAMDAVSCPKPAFP